MCASFRSVFSLVLLLTFTGWAGTTGKISGVIKSAETGEPLVGVNIVLEGTTLGTSSDADGYYFILNIPPGEYTVAAYFLGYAAKIQQEVKVSADQTTTLHFSMVAQAVEGETVVVTAERPLIQKDQTARTAVVDAETISEMPVDDFQDVLTTQAGFTTDDDGEIHVRGGRSGEVAYLIDGVYVRDPYSGGFGSQLDRYSIEELQVLTGSYNAEYGQALSGVINIVTKEGGQDYRGRLEYQSARLNESPYRRTDWILETDAADGLSQAEVLEFRDSQRDSLNQSLYQLPDYDQEGTPEFMTFTGSLVGNFSGPVPRFKNLTFFLSGNLNNAPGYLPWGYNKSGEFNGKLTYTHNQLKLNFFVQRNQRDWKPYSHRWKYNPDGYENRESRVAREGLILTHTLTPSTYYEARFSRFNRRFDRFLPGKSATFEFDEATGAFEFVESLSNFERPVQDNVSGFWLRGDNGTIDDRDVETYTARIDVTSQVSRHHLIKFGGEFIRHTISRETFIQPWPGENHRYENFTRRPVEFSLYAQDKLEHDRFILNLGMRFDYSDPRHTMWPQLDEPGQIVDDVWVPSEEVPVDPKIQISPRLGLGLPITANTYFYGSYGHFFQIPSYLEMFGPHRVNEDQPLIGNPAIEPQKTVAFEAGIRQVFYTDYVLDVNLFFKDITNLAGSTYYGVFPFEYTLYDNSDYASVNGIDVSITKRLNRFFGGGLNYTYSVAKGNESDPREGFNDYRRANFPLRPKRIFYLDFDRRHDAALTMNFSFPRSRNAGFLKSLIGDSQVNILFEAVSGLPYTPSADDAGEGLLVEKNTARQQPTLDLDLKLLKTFRMQNFKLKGFVTVRNLLDRRNPLNVWSRTGQSWDAGPFSTRPIDRQYNPTNVTEPRRVIGGFRIEF